MKKAGSDQKRPCLFYVQILLLERLVIRMYLSITGFVPFKHSVSYDDI